MELKLIDSIKSRESLIFIETIEEEETIGILKNVSATINHSLILWDANNGFKDITPKGAEKPLLPSELNVSDLNRMFKQIEDYPDDAIFVIKDTKYYVNDRIDPKELAKLVRKLKELKLRLKNKKKTLVSLGESFNLVTDLTEEFSLYIYGRPDVKNLRIYF